MTARQPAPPSMVLRPEEIERFDRGNGVVTVPLVGRWNCADNRLTSGTTTFAAGTGLPLHSHNVEETVLVHAGEATAVVGDDEFDLVAGQATWVPAAKVVVPDVSRLSAQFQRPTNGTVTTPLPRSKRSISSGRSTIDGGTGC